MRCLRDDKELRPLFDAYLRAVLDGATAQAAFDDVLRADLGAIQRSFDKTLR